MPCSPLYGTISATIYTIYVRFRTISSVRIMRQWIIGCIGIFMMRIRTQYQPITADTVTLANFLRESKTPSLLASTGRYPRLAATLDSVVMLRPEYIECPLPGRLTERFPMRDEVLTRHREAVANHQPTYRDPLSGYSVFTAAFLARR